MPSILSNWWKKYFSDETAILLAIIIIVSVLVITFFNDILTPVFTSIILAFILEKLVNFLTNQLGWCHIFSTLFVYSISLGLIIVLMIVALPVIVEQVIIFSHDLPDMLATLKAWLIIEARQYPQLIDIQKIQDFSNDLNAKLVYLIQSQEAHYLAKWVASFSLSSAMGLMTVIIYSLSVPILVLLMLADKAKILDWLDHNIISVHGKQLCKISNNITDLINRYIYGKLIEMFIVGIVTYMVFAGFGLKYAVLLAICTGLSVVVPYVGAIIITIPIVLVAAAQWGMTPIFFYLIGAHALIQLLDGNILVPILFSEAVKLHPIAILLSVIVFGGLWGVWGIFFAIPLAIVIKVLMKSWPRQNIL